MADELRLKARAVYSPSLSGMEGVDSGLFDVYVSMTGDDYSSFTQEIGTSEEALDIPTDIGTVGYILVKNLDSTNFVEVGLTGSYTIKLKAGEIALFRADGDIYAIADTDACIIQAYVFED